MKIFVFILIFLLGLHAEELRGTFITEPVFKASVYMQTIGNPENPAVILVHGLGDEASTIWESTIDFLKNDYYVITFDLPGFGQSSKSNELYSPLNYAKFIHYVAQTYVKKPFYLVGHSMGGAISLKYASMYPSDVQSLVLVDAAGILHKFAYSQFLIHAKVDRFFEEQNGLVQRLQTPKFNAFVDKMTDKFDNKMHIDMDKVLASESLRESVLGGTPSSIAAVALVQTNFSPLLTSIQTPTTIIWGGEDEIAPIQTAYVLRKLLPNARFVTIPKAAHVPMISHEDAFLARLSEHFKGNVRDELPSIRRSEPYSLKIKNVKEKVYTGTIQSLYIENSEKIVIKDATIEELNLFGSEVEVINSVIKGRKEVAITAQNSRLTMVASDIEGAMKLNNAKLNLAGIHMSNNGKPFRAEKYSTVIFSLCRVNGNDVHGKEIFEQ